MRFQLCLTLALTVLPASAFAQTDDVMHQRELQIAKHGPSRTPQKAPARREGGTASVICTVVQAKRLDGCVVERETPDGADVGTTVIRYARDLRLEPVTIHGAPIDGRRVRISMAFPVGKFGELLHCPKSDDIWYICTWRR